MTKFWLSPYHLTFIHSGKRRQGYLLKVQDPDFEQGYADIFPWPEFGDPLFQDIPNLLKVNRLSPLLKRSMETARVDGLARAQKKSLLEGLKRRNHYLVQDIDAFTTEELIEAQEKNFRCFKIKVCRHPEFEISQLEGLRKLLNRNSLLRLDANAMGNESFFKNLESIRDKVEFIEDPFGDCKLWQSQWPFAYDQPGFDFEKVQTSWQIIKPAKQSKEDIKAKKLIYTSSMDHPVGLAHGLLFASQQGPQIYDDGFMSYKVYRKTPFHSFIHEEGPWLSFQPGLGVGFDEILKQQEWTEL